MGSMTSGVAKKLPFGIRRDDGRTLVQQVVDGVRGAIHHGYYKPGDLLPRYEDFAPAIGVSEIVVRGAVRQLAEEGYLSVRPRLGTVVRDCGAKQWRGHVVMVYPWGDDGYFQTILISALRDALAGEGYLFTQACVRGEPDGKRDFSSLDAALAHSADFAIALHDDAEIFRHLASRKIPYAAIGHIHSTPPGSIAATIFDNSKAAVEFAEACAAAGVREVVAIFWTRLMDEFGPAFAKVGISLRKHKVFPDISAGRICGVERAGRFDFEHVIASHRLAPDTVYFFVDDHLARGALTAISYAGLHIPEDVRIATFANTGLVPDYPRELSRIEIDPFAIGGEIARRIVEYLKTGCYPSAPNVGPRWIEGETISPMRRVAQGQLKGETP